MNVSIIGTGYVGLVVGAGLAGHGNDVCCFDVDSEKISSLKKGRMPMFEPGLHELIGQNVKAGRLHFTTNIKEAVDSALVIFIAVPTPPDVDGSADLRHVLEAARSIGLYLSGYKVVVNKSTVPIGTTAEIRRVINDTVAWRGISCEFDVVSNPEFLREGSAVTDFMRPDRMIIGSDSRRAAKVIEELYLPITREENPLIVMDVRSAEMTKYAANAMLATRISFINQIANLCELTEADIDSVSRGIGSDSRIGPEFLSAGIGYGGSCLPKDLKAFIKKAEEQDYNFTLLRVVEGANDFQRRMFVNKIERYFKKIRGRRQLNGLVFAIWGLAFKPNTDDIREAPSIKIIECLLEKGAIVKVHDPAAIETTKKYLGGRVEYFQDQYDVLCGCDALIILTEWDEYKTADMFEVKRQLSTSVIFDGRNLYKPEKIQQLGFEYFSIGRTAHTNKNL